MFTLFFKKNKNIKLNMLAQFKTFRRSFKLCHKIFFLVFPFFQVFFFIQNLPMIPSSVYFPHIAHFFNVSSLRAITANYH